MKQDSSWDCGTEIFVQRLGMCVCYHRMIHGEYYQFKIKYGFTIVIGEPSYDNKRALDNVFIELKKRYKSIFNNY